MPKYEEAHKEHINKYKMAHMIGVAEYMRERAEDYGIDPDVAYTIGLLHDIGYLAGRNDHEKEGADILCCLGVQEESEAYNAVRYHGSNPYTLSPSDISPLLVLTYEADLSVDSSGHRVGFNKRLENIAFNNRNNGYGDVAVETASQTIKFVKEYQERNGIPKPPKGFFDISHEKGREK